VSGRVTRAEYERLERELAAEMAADGTMPVYRTHPAEPEEPRSERPIAMEQIRGPGADFGPGLFLVGLALCVALLVVLL
jgi:hypothetical protein